MVLCINNAVFVCDEIADLLRLIPYYLFLDVV